MSTQNNINFHRIEQAIDYIRTNFKQQPTLEEVASSINLSPYHFQRVFTQWAGVSPKKFLQYTTIEYIKQQIDTHTNLLDASIDAGLSGTSRLHDLFLNIEAMTPGEYKNRGKNLTIYYSFAHTFFGDACIASTHKGICYLAFGDTTTTFTELIDLFQKAQFVHSPQDIHQKAIAFLKDPNSITSPLHLHLQGTPFQLKVWDALLKIPLGSLTTYRNIGRAIGKPKANRAIGTAIGSNPISYIIPCHRVIRTNGELGGYHWGLNLKIAMIGWEGLQKEAR